MPKEQIRKRGKRKPKHVDEGADNVGAVHEVANTNVVPDVSEAGPSSSGAPAAAGIHPSRLALLKGGYRANVTAPSYPVGATGGSGQEAGQGQQLGQTEMGQSSEGNAEEGAAQWVRGPREESEFPFGVLDPDVKAYFKTVEEQIMSWEGTSSAGEEREGEWAA
jgi:nucleolar protein 9